MIENAVRTLARAANFATLTTLMPDGHPQTNVMWVDADDEHIYMNSEVHRQKFKNIQRDPRVTVVIMSSANPYEYAEVRGRVVEIETGDAGRAGIDTLSRKYLGRDYPTAVQSERVGIKITPDRQRVWLT